MFKEVNPIKKYEFVGFDTEEIEKGDLIIVKAETEYAGTRYSGVVESITQHELRVHTGRFTKIIYASDLTDKQTKFTFEIYE